MAIYGCKKLNWKTGTINDVTVRYRSLKSKTSTLGKFSSFSGTEVVTIGRGTSSRFQDIGSAFFSLISTLLGE